MIERAFDEWFAEYGLQPLTGNPPMWERSGFWNCMQVWLIDGVFRVSSPSRFPHSVAVCPIPSSAPHYYSAQFDLFDPDCFELMALSLSRRSNLTSWLSHLFDQLRGVMLP